MHTSNMAPGQTCPIDFSGSWNDEGRQKGRLGEQVWCECGRRREEDQLEVDGRGRLPGACIILVMGMGMPQMEWNGMRGNPSHVEEISGGR